jgi:hypothetical protein
MTQSAGFFARAIQRMTAKTIEALLEDIRFLSEERYATVEAVRALVRQTIRPLSEEVKYGGILFASTLPFGGVFAYQGHVSVEFSHGAAIADTLGLLEGGGKLRRHLKLHSPDDVAARKLAEYLPLALAAAKDKA